MKLKKIISLVLVSAMAMASLTSCGGESESTNSGDSDVSPSANVKEEVKDKSENTEISFWTLSSRQVALDPIIEEFNATNGEGITVSASYYDTDGIKNMCKVAATSKTLPNMWFNWGGALGSFYSDNGLSYDLTQYASDNNWDEKFNKNVLELSTFDGKVSGYPTSYNVISIYYRKDIFDQYGLSEPQTFEEFEKVCATLKENGVTPMFTGGLNGWHTMRFVELLIEHYAGAQLHDSMNAFNESYNNEAVVKAFEKYKEFCDKGYFPQGFLTQDPNDYFITLANGQCAMDLQGQWCDGTIIDNGVDMDKFGVFAFPSNTTSRLSSFAEMTQFSASNTPEQLDACVKFMDYYYSEENVAKYSVHYKVPLTKKDYVMTDEYPLAVELLSLADEHGTFTITDQAFPPEVADVLFNAQEGVATDQMTPEQAAKNIEEAIESYKNK